MAIATTGKDVLAKFFDEGAYSALYADGAVTAAFGSANGTPVYAVCQTGAAVAEKDTEKVVKVLDMAAKTGNPVVTFYNSVGAKLEEGLAALSGSAAVAAAVAKVSGVVPQIAVVTGVCGAGSALAAAAAGAQVTHVDASKGMVTWAKENAAASGLSEAPIRWLVDDCVKFVQREQRRGNTYDGIIMDPPSYGRGPGGEVWKLEEQLYHLVELCLPILSKQPLFFILNSYTTGLSPAVMEYLLGVMLKKPFGGTVSSSEIGLPVTSSGFVLPCGSTAIWQSK